MKIAIYSRKSKFTGKGDSIGNQIELCKDYAERYFDDIEDYYIYEDEGFSGGDTNRPKFQELMRDAQNKKFDVLICYRLDRVSRDVADFSATIENLNSLGIDFVSIKEQFDTSTPMGSSKNRTTIDFYIKVDKTLKYLDLPENTLGTRIRKHRLLNQYTNQDLSEKVGMTYSSISSIQSDNGSLGRENLRKMAAALGVSVNYLKNGQ